MCSVEVSDVIAIVIAIINQSGSGNEFDIPQDAPNQFVGVKQTGIAPQTSITRAGAGSSGTTGGTPTFTVVPDQ